MLFFYNKNYIKKFILFYFGPYDNSLSTNINIMFDGEYKLNAGKLFGNSIKNIIMERCKQDESIYRNNDLNRRELIITILNGFYKNVKRLIKIKLKYIIKKH